jgi:hypothetical protein
MQFPTEWSDKQAAPQPASKRRRVNNSATNTPTTNIQANKQPPHAKHEEELKELLTQCDTEQAHLASLNPNQDYDDSIIGTIKRQINNNRFAPATPEELQLDHVLSSVPYRDMLESLFGSVTGQPSALPIVTKAYEESYMREAQQGERQCAMGSKCECMFVDFNAPFVAVQFDLPNELTPEPEKPEPEKPKLCVLCSRKATQKLFYDTCYSGRP